MDKPEKLKVILRVFGIIAIILTIFPFIAVDYWFVRVFDFPHLQLTLLTMIALLTYLLRFDMRSITDYAFVFALSGCFLFQGYKIFPYTAFVDFEVKAAEVDADDSLSIYTANVLQKNTKFQLLIDDCMEKDADLLLFTETDKKWLEKLISSLRDYTYQVAVPLENTYGMLLLSKRKLYDEKVMFLIEDTIPSISTKLLVNAKDTLQLFAIHPAPPTPQHNPSSVDRDAEMMKVAKMTRSSKLPVIVMGDFNDVAWSETTSLFQNVSSLLDLRKGRGFYSTYNAKSWLMRWPLDHVFTSPEFRVKKVERRPYVNSDYFPFYAQLSYEPNKAGEQRLKPPTKEQMKKAFEQIENEIDKKEDE